MLKGYVSLSIIWLIIGVQEEWFGCDHKTLLIKPIIWANNGFRGTASLYLGLQTWWRGSFNYYFFGKALWEEDIQVRELLQAYCDCYYGAQSDEVFLIYDKILNDVQEGGYFNTMAKDRDQVY